MALSKCMFFVSLFTCVLLTEPAHPGEHGPDAFHSILSTLPLGSKNQTLQIKDVNWILTQLEIHDCSNASNKCVTAETLFKIFNISNSSSVGEEEFSKFAPIIVYALLPNEHHSGDEKEHEGENNHNHHDHEESHDHEDHDDEDHDDEDHDDEDHDDEDHDEDGIKEILQNVPVYKELLERYQTGVLCEQIIDQLLNDVNHTTGQLNTGIKCFSSDDIFHEHEQNISSDGVIGESLLPVISVSIISRLIQKQCIQVRYQTPLPCSSYFSNKLFNKYAENNVINETKMEELFTKLKLMSGHDDDHDESHDDDHDESHDDDPHDHRRRRRSSTNILVHPMQSQFRENELRSLRRYRRESGNREHHKETNKYQKCYSVDEIFAIYHVDKKTGFTLEEFERLTSALLEQVESETCSREAHHEHGSDDDVDTKQKWGYGILTVAIISLCSLVGVAIIPFMDTMIYHKAVVFLISLAVGTLVGDAFLHLFPHALAFHAGHDHAHDSETSTENEERDYLWKFLVASAAVYSFFLIETLTHLFFRKSIGHSHSMEHTRRHSQFSAHEDYHERNATEECVVESGHKHPANVPVVLENMAYIDDEGTRHETMYEKKSKVSPSKSSEIKEKREVKKTISSVVWNIIIGDTIHNVADGIAIGVAFSSSITGGVSTAIAVLCHELPHELGDFAVLLSAGMSVKKALLANFLSACACFIGFFFGVLISEIEDANLWIFAATGGFFIYIALTNMLPELMHSADFNAIPKFSRFFLQNLGILTGFAIMFLLSYYEEDINI